MPLKIVKPMAKKTGLDTEFIDLEKVVIPQPQRIAASKNGMVSTAHYRATEAGAEILAEGGNAIDAAVASAFALGVCEPQASGLGGQTLMLIHLAESGRTFALDGSSHAPNRALKEMFTEKKTRLSGIQATTVPATPAALGYALKTYGTLPLKRVLEPSIALAKDGYQITALQNRLQHREVKSLKKRNAGNFFLNGGEKASKPGTIFKQPLLAQTLGQLAEKGTDDFYMGEIAESIIRDMENNNGLIHRDDLARIPHPIERELVNCRFGNMMVYTMPPPGSGRTLIEMLNILKKFPVNDRNPDSPEGALLLAEIMRRAQLDRRDRPFDPNFYPQVQDSRMLSNDYAKLVADQIKKRIKTTGDTTHLSVMDKNGNVVSLTQSIERVFGAKIVNPELGFLYNNYMSAFDYEDLSHPYYLRPNAVPWASVAPTIIFKAKKPWLTIGSPGSERIVTTIAQVLIRLARQSPFDAVAAPRMHCSLGGKVSLEAAFMRSDIPEFLERYGFSIDIREPMSFYLGCVQMVLWENSEFIGVADPRRDGSAMGI